MKNRKPSITSSPTYTARVFGSVRDGHFTVKLHHKADIQPVLAKLQHKVKKGELDVLLHNGESFTFMWFPKSPKGITTGEQSL